MGMNDFAPYYPQNTSFIVKNISPQNKTIKIFNYPIPMGQMRNLLEIPGIDEVDLRGSLLKGELNHKLRSNDIIVIASDIDLTQYNNAQITFLQSYGIVNGLFGASSGGDVVTNDSHEILRQLIHFIDEGPGDGFLSGAYKVIVGQPFPTSITWYADNSMSMVIVRKVIAYNANHFPITIAWSIFDVDGVTIVHTVKDSIVYNGSFESSRTRTIS